MAGNIGLNLRASTQQTQGVAGKGSTGSKAVGLEQIKDLGGAVSENAVSGSTLVASKTSAPVVIAANLFDGQVQSNEVARGVVATEVQKASMADSKTESMTVAEINTKIDASSLDANQKKVAKDAVVKASDGAVVLEVIATATGLTEKDVNTATGISEA